MANVTKSQVDTIETSKKLKESMNNINTLIGQANLKIYGTDRDNGIENLNNKFQKLLNNQINTVTNGSNENITSFLGRIIQDDSRNAIRNEIIDNEFMQMSGEDFSSVQSFIYESYRNKILEQADIHEVSSQLIELSEAILITRDAIVSADVVEGRMSRTLSFENLSDEEATNSISIVEKMEEKFKLQEKIKNFIIPKTLEYGEYYAYIIPYSVLFNALNRGKLKHNVGLQQPVYSESGDCTVYESFDPKAKKNSEDNFDKFVDDIYTEYAKTSSKDKKNMQRTVNKSEFKSDIKNILSNITINNTDTPLPIMEEGYDSIKFMADHHMMFEDSGETSVDDINKKREIDDLTGNKNIFNALNKKKHDENSAEGLFDDKGEFSDITDCYFRLIEPTRIIPVKIMSTVIGYYYVQDEDIVPLAGSVSSNLYFTKFDDNRKESNIIDAIAKRVVGEFDKPFLKRNIKFKKAIVDCFNYYNLNEKRVKFQFIPAQYIQEFKIDEDVNGNGQSMIKKSLFYAKLYLMLLLFKVMSIILYSNDTKVNYIKQSGIDKDVSNKIQEIARIKQSRQINMTDLFSYTNLINKVGNGNEMYVPVGRSGERPIETDVLQGEEVQLNNDLLEMLKNAYILGTGVPAAIVNYMNEADFAKVVEQNNTKFNGRVVNYQLDFNDSITKMYKKLLKWSTKLDPSLISNFKFSLQPPKTAAISAKGELINQFNQLSDFLSQLMFDDPQTAPNPDDANKTVRQFKELLAEEQLPMIDMNEIRKIVDKAAENVHSDKLKPDASNGDNGNDDGLVDDLNKIEV